MTGFVAGIGLGVVVGLVLGVLLGLWIAWPGVQQNECGE